MTALLPTIREVIVVEGKYDKIAVQAVVSATVLQTNGFRIFRDKSIRTLLRTIAQERGLLILTDSDAAGTVIRGHLQSFLPQGCYRHLVAPALEGKEPRKTAPSAAGILGVEGLPRHVLLDTLRPFFSDAPPSEPVTKADLYAWGLSGHPDSKAKRQALMESRGIPTHLSANMLCAVLSVFPGRDAVLAMLTK